MRILFLVFLLLLITSFVEANKKLEKRKLVCYIMAELAD